MQRALLVTALLVPAGLAGCTKEKATTAAAPARPAERSALPAPLWPGAAQYPEKRKQAAATLALYCQSIASSWPSSADGNAWLPEHTGLFADAAFSSLDLPALLGLGG